MGKGSVLLVIAGTLGLCAWLILAASPDVVAQLGGTDPDSAAAIKFLAGLFTFVGALLLFGFMATAAAGAGTASAGAGVKRYDPLQTQSIKGVVPN